MAFSLYSDLSARMISELPMCPSAIITQEVQRSGVEFFTSSGVWLETLDDMNIVANQSSYTLSLPSNSQLLQIYSVKVNYDPTNNPFDSLPPIASYSYKLSEDQTSLEFYSFSTPTTSVTGGLQIKVQLIPTWNATGVPTQYLNRYASGLMARAKYNLMMQPKKPWSNPQLAQRWLGVYNDQMVEASRDKDTGNINCSMSMNIPEF